MRTRRTQSSSNSMSARHQTVLLHEAVEALKLKPDSVVFDATLGAMGHAREIIAQLGSGGLYIGMDADKTAIDPARETLVKNEARLELIHGNFRNMRVALASARVRSIDAALFDLGWRAEQLSGDRGFSFLHDGPLLMTYDSNPGIDSLTARQIVNEWDETSIADIIYGWGEESFARRIARAITERRRKSPIETTFELADIIMSTVPAWYRGRRIHPATKTFQALRIAVNDEMSALKEGLSAAIDLLGSHGRACVISFHSIEDRLVKHFFREKEHEGIGSVITKKPIAPGMEEVARNPRARSAKLRVFEKH